MVGSSWAEPEERGGDPGEAIPPETNGEKGPDGLDSTVTEADVRGAPPRVLRRELLRSDALVVAEAEVAAVQFLQPGEPQSLALRALMREHRDALGLERDLDVIPDVVGHCAARRKAASTLSDWCARPGIASTLARSPPVAFQASTRPRSPLRSPPSSGWARCPAGYSPPTPTCRSRRQSPTAARSSPARPRCRPWRPGSAWPHSNAGRTSVCRRPAS